MSTKKTKVVKPQRNQYMQVFVRCRPFNDNEAHQRSSSIVDIQSHKELAVQDRCNSKIIKTFSFDKVFGPSNSQADVYQSVVEPLISDVLSGFNCTVFAYGQTGSGKTFTMEGELDADPMFSADSKAGLIPRAMCALFDELHVLQAEYTVRISFLELYNEELYDLLSPDDIPPKLRLFDDTARKGSVIIQGLQEVMVHTQSQVLDELRKGSAKRQAAATLMNAHSSRSHTIFCVTVHSKENSVDGEELLKTGKLYLVDLAGSENIARSGSVDKRAREAANINQSLLTLGRVITCLVEHQPHIPYRESKLTRLLQDSLGGRMKTSMIATVSPAHCNVEETLSTLDYAHRAKSVANKPEVNQKVSQKVIMKEYMDVIDDLKKKLDLHRNGSGVYVNDANYKLMIDQTREKNKELSEKIAQIRAVQQKMKSIEDYFCTLSSTLEEHKLNLENVEKTIEKTSEEIGVAAEGLSKVTNEKEEVGHLLNKLCDQENELRSQAEHLIGVVETSHADSDNIHKRLDISRNIILTNQGTFLKLKEKARLHSDAIQKMCSSLNSAQNILGRLLSAIESLNYDTKRDLVTLTQRIHSLKEMSCKSMKVFQSLVQDSLKARKADALKTSSDMSQFWLEFVKNLEHCDKIISDACVEYQLLMSKLPQQSSSLMDFVQKSARNMKDATGLQMEELSEKFSNIQIESDQNVRNVVDLLNNLLQAEQEPYNDVKKNLKISKENTSAIRAISLKAHEKRTALTTKLGTNKECFETKVSAIKENMVATVGYLQNRGMEVPTDSKTVVDVLITHSQPLLSGVQEKSQSIMECVGNSLGIINKAEEAANHLLSRDVQGPVSQILETRKQDRVQTMLATQNEANTCVNDFVQATIQINHDLSSKFEEINENERTYEQREDESLGMLLEGINSTKFEIQQHLDTEKSTVSQIMESELGHDVPTGQTPVRKSHGLIPKLASLASPIMRKVKSRVQNAIVLRKRILRSPRKPLSSTTSLQDIDDDCMASDSELTFTKKNSNLCGLQKASSLTDLRSNAVFHRPRIPKKYGRKAQ